MSREKSSIRHKEIERGAQRERERHTERVTEPSDRDVEALEKKLDKVQMQFRIMNEERQASTRQAKELIRNKQGKNTSSSLRSEKEKIMPHGRSAIRHTELKRGTEREKGAQRERERHRERGTEPRDRNVHALETELDKLQMQYRSMQGERQAYACQSQEIIRKQGLEMEKLRHEQEELQKNMHVCKSRSRKQMDSQVAQQLKNLLERSNELDEQLKKERQTQVELEREIQSTQKKLKMLRKEDASTQKKPKKLRKGDASAFLIQKLPPDHVHKTTPIVEDKLERANNRLNQQLVRNSQLKEELEKLHQKRAHFEHLKCKLEKELQKTKKGIGAIINISTAANNSRVETQKKLTEMIEKAVKDQVQYKNEVDNLKKQIADEQCHIQFMTTKCKERTGLDNTLSHRQAANNSGAAESLEEVFQQIQKVTGEDNLETLATKFIQAEDRNLELFNYVTEQNTQAETLKNEIRQTKDLMERFQAEEAQEEQVHHTTLKQLEEQPDYESQVKETTEILDKIGTGLSNLFDKLGGDRTLADLHSSSADSNIMTYLRLVEQKASKMLFVQAIQSKVQIRHSAELQKQADAAPSSDSRKVNYLEDLMQSRPLTQGELRQNVKNRIIRKEEALHAEKHKKARSAKPRTTDKK